MIWKNLPIETTIRLTKPLRGVVTFENQSTFIPSNWSHRGFKQCLTLSNLDPKKDVFVFFLTFFETGSWKDGCFQLDDSQNFTTWKSGWKITFSIHLAKLLGSNTFRVQISHQRFPMCGNRLIKKMVGHLNQAGLQHAPSSLISSKEARKNLMVFFFTPRLGFFFESTREGWSSIRGVDFLTHGKQWFSFC